LLVAGATVLDGSGRRLEATDVLVHDGRIAAVGQQLERRPGVEVIDAGGRWLTPGIIDVHSHDGTYVLPLGTGELTFSDLSELSRPNAAQVRILDAIDAQDSAFEHALAGGVTTLQIVPGSRTLFAGRTAVLKNVPAVLARDMVFPGAPAGLKMACGENPKDEFGGRDLAPTSRMGELAEMRAAFEAARRYRQAWRDYRGDPVAPGAPRKDAALETLAGVLDGDVRVHLHCYRADDIVAMLELADDYGFRIAAIHHATEAYKIPGQLAAHGACAAVWADWWGYKDEAGDAIRANAAMIDAQGVCTAMHSDSPVVGQRLNIEAAKAMGAGRRANLVVPPERAIRWLTSNPAKILGLEQRVGQVAAGFDADLVLWSGDPFSIYSHADQVFVDGARVYDRFDPSRQPIRDRAVGIPAQRGQP
jgi:imidazolonepropionase-like amidohydrolase